MFGAFDPIARLLSGESFKLAFSGAETSFGRAAQPSRKVYLVGGIADGMTILARSWPTSRLVVAVDGKYARYVFTDVYPDHADATLFARHDA